MNIKINKKFVLGQRDAPPLSQKEQRQQVLTHNRFNSSQVVSTFLDEDGIQILARDGPGAPLTVPVRDQIEQIESILDSLQKDLKQSREDLNQLRVEIDTMKNNTGDDFTDILDTCSNKMNELGVWLKNDISSYSDILNLQNQDTTQLRADFDDHFNFARNLSLYSNQIVNEVGFRTVYKF